MDMAMLDTLTSDLAEKVVLAYAEFNNSSTRERYKAELKKEFSQIIATSLSRARRRHELR